MTQDSSSTPASGPDDEVIRRADILARLQGQIDWYEREARRNNWGHKACKIISITTAAAVVVLAAASSDPMLIAAMGALIVVAQGVQELFQFQANWVTFGRTKEVLKREQALYRAKAGPYQRTDHPDRLLAERTEAVAALELETWAETQLSEHPK